jgi:hypothetical protein
MTAHIRGPVQDLPKLLEPTTGLSSVTYYGAFEFLGNMIFLSTRAGTQAVFPSAFLAPINRHVMNICISG